MPTLGLSAAFTIGTNLLGIRNDPYMAFNFLVEIEGLVVGGFTDVTGLQGETEVFPHREGGLNEYVHQLPGPMRYPQNLQLKYGVTDLPTLWLWFHDVSQGLVKRKNGTIYLLDRQGLPAMWWDFLQAYPVRWIGPELRAGNNAVAVETMELAHNGIVKPQDSTLFSAARGIASVGAQLF